MSSSGPAITLSPIIFTIFWSKIRLAVDLKVPTIGRWRERHHNISSTWMYCIRMVTRRNMTVSLEGQYSS